MAVITEQRPAAGAPDQSAPLTRIALTGEEVAAIRKLADEIAAKFDSVEDPEFLREAAVWAQELPRRVRKVLVEFRQLEPEAAHLVISGFPIDEEEIGPTPEHWNRPDETRSPALAYEIFFVLASSLLGEPIGWRTQQHGRVVHDLMPVKGMEKEQIGIGSEMTIWWHTEDAFHPMRGDYLGMFCLRNPDEVPTTFATLENVKISPRHWELLFQPHYIIKPDNSHQPVNAAPEDETELQQVYRRIEQMKRHPDKIAILSGDPRSPYVRIDHYFMDRLEDNAEAQEALDAFVKAVDEQIGDLALNPGDMCFIDNMKAVHGRRAFKARYDGKDRWFKRINITRDLRKSRAERSSAASRIIQ